MLTLPQVQSARERAAAMLDRVGIVLTAKERDGIEVADLGLGELERTGLELVTYVNTDRYCAKEIILFPRQTCPEHRHPAVAGESDSTAAQGALLVGVNSRCKPAAPAPPFIPPEGGTKGGPASHTGGTKRPAVAAPGKMETFRCRWGRVFLCVPGQPTPGRKPRVPAGSEAYYTVFHEIELAPGDQFTIPPDTLHWFQAGDQGAVISEFSSTSRDEADIFTDPRIRRIPEVS